MIEDEISEISFLTLSLWLNHGKISFYSSFILICKVSTSTIGDMVTFRKQDNFESGYFWRCGREFLFWAWNKPGRYFAFETFVDEYAMREFEFLIQSAWGIPSGSHLMLTQRIFHHLVLQFFAISPWQLAVYPLFTTKNPQTWWKLIQNLSSDQH